MDILAMSISVLVIIVCSGFSLWITLRKIAEVHMIVNSQRLAMETKIAALEKIINARTTADQIKQATDEMKEPPPRGVK